MSVYALTLYTTLYVTPPPTTPSSQWISDLASGVKAVAPMAVAAWQLGQQIDFDSIIIPPPQSLLQLDRAARMADVGQVQDYSSSPNIDEAPVAGWDCFRFVMLSYASKLAL